MTRMRRRCSRERGRKFFNRATRRALELILHLLLIHNFAGTGGAAGQIAECPPPETIPGCPCYNFDDGLFLECAGATEDTLRSTLLSVLSVSGECTKTLAFSNSILPKNFFDTQFNFHASTETRGIVIIIEITTFPSPFRLSDQLTFNGPLRHRVSSLLHEVTVL